MIILHVTGRRYDIPVGFADLGGRLVVVGQHRWPRNLDGGVDLEVTRFGRRQPMRADLVEQALERYGAVDVTRRMGIVFDAGSPPGRCPRRPGVRSRSRLLTPAR